MKDKSFIDTNILFYPQITQISTDLILFNPHFLRSSASYKDFRFSRFPLRLCDFALL